MRKAGSDQGALRSDRRGGRACLLGRWEARQARPLRGFTTAAGGSRNRPGGFGFQRQQVHNRQPFSEEQFNKGHGQTRAERPVRRILGSTMWPPKRVIHDLRERQLHDEDRTCGFDPRIPD